MLVQEVSSIFAFAFIIGLGFLSNYFLHRVEVNPLRLWKEVKIAQTKKTNRKTENYNIAYLIRKSILANLLVNELTKI
jgi:hypothetical protein